MLFRAGRATPSFEGVRVGWRTRRIRQRSGLDTVRRRNQDANTRNKAKSPHLHMNRDHFFQSGHRVRLDWCWDGCARAGERGDVVVVVDVLRFSTAVVAAASRGVAVVPLIEKDERYEAATVSDPLKPATYESLPASVRRVAV